MWISQLVATPERRAENEVIFQPGSLSILSPIQAADFEDDLELDGISIGFHGWGYFYPATRRNLVEEWCENTKLAEFRNKVVDEFTCSFRPPLSKHDRAKKFLLTDEPNWPWMTSETG
jgi:hypothetical protein